MRRRKEKSAGDKSRLRIPPIWLLPAILLVGCTASDTVKEDAPPIQDETDLDGGRTGEQGADAPKAVESTEITDFSCRFSTADLAEEDFFGDFSGSGWYAFTAAQDDGGVSGSCSIPERDAVEFTTDAAFLEKLDAIVKAYDLAVLNGQHWETSGLPPDYGYALRISYASGESVSASDNADCALSPGAMEALTKLFCEAADMTP